MRWLAILPLSLAVGLLPGCREGAGAGETAAEPAIDLSRYAGRWYVIAASGAVDGVGAYREYRVRDDGFVESREHWRDGSLGAALQERRRLAEPDPGGRRWRVEAGWFWSAEEQVLYVSPDYRHALVVAKRHAWILARAPEIPEWEYAGLLTRLALHGYEVSGLRRVPHAPEPIGDAAFE